MITYFTEGVEKPKICTKRCNAWIKEIAAEKGKKIGEIAYVFCSEEKILEVNRQYLGHDYYTDIITFDYSEQDKLSADIFVSTETVASNAASLGNDYFDELSRVIIHGILHLCGYKDKSPDESSEMRRQEDMALARLPKPLKK